MFHLSPRDEESGISKCLRTGQVWIFGTKQGDEIGASCLQEISLAFTPIIDLYLTGPTDATTRAMVSSLSVKPEAQLKASHEFSSRQVTAEMQRSVSLKLTKSRLLINFGAWTSALACLVQQLQGM
ncbi:hypothetical protein GUJ93_ZPchr0010g10535 [Zizania palustris]|uniref:Uncharacterized protein n=1 Tax=Zizania palustris TaxID=103762 RepID=A0A8J6BAP0_ZIZPA|nr:hypothetical protein GUJ93_ZPchr0010g10535 [Zizania palustris]